MKSSLNNSTFIDADLLQRFFDGKLSVKETDEVSTLIANDELMREAFSGLNGDGFVMVQSISNSVNFRIDKMMNKPPIFQRWVFWLSVFIGIILISATAIMMLPDNNDSSKYVANTSIEKKETNDKSQKKKKSNESKDKDESEKNEERKTNHVSNDNTLNFNSDNKSILSISDLNKSKDSTKKQIVVNDGINDGPDDKKVIDNKMTNPNTIDQGTNTTKKKTKLRLSDASVLIAQNLAEKEASADDNRNHDVRDPNIGNSASTKKSNSFNIDDMPQYPGGIDALGAYVKGRLATKTYSIEQKGISTMVEFVVTSKGKVEDIKLQNVIDPAMEKDIRDCLSQLKFSSGKKSGKKGSMHYTMALVYE